jgi:hypothetical protein
MNDLVYNAFVQSHDTLRVYAGDTLVFDSNKNGLLALLEYIASLAYKFSGVTVFDKIAGNAAALLSIKAGCNSIESPLGSQQAVRTLEKYGVNHHITTIVPSIQQHGRVEMCPMEKLSIGKDPEAFYLMLNGSMSFNMSAQTG